MIALRDYYNTGNAESQERRENLYDFDIGRVRLDWENRPTRFYATLDGADLMDGLPEGCRLNPYIAAMYFTQGVSRVLREKVKEWLRINGYNTLTGCRINLPCEECRRKGLESPENGCVKNGKDKSG